MHPRPSLLVIARVSALLLYPFGALASVAPMGGDCPATLSNKAISVSAPKGWRAAPPYDLALSGAGMMSGPPESERHLIPAKQTRKGKKFTQTWNFLAGDEKWLACKYGPVGGGGDAVLMGLRLDNAARTCTLTGSLSSKRPTYSVRCEQ